MANQIDIWIGQAEETWLQPLYSHARDLYRSTYLPSHDHSHHLRVWFRARRLLQGLAATRASLKPDLVQGVLIAALFHDLGMARSTREDHGRLGRELCQSWFAQSGRQVPPGFDKILEAIEMHDRKQDRSYGKGQRPGTPGILEILSVADDLDAAGVIGIYRYAEIYLLRGIPLKELGTRILENAGLRFDKLRAFCRDYGQEYDPYRKEVDELGQFYDEYRRQSMEAEQADGVREGPLGVINYIRTRGIGQRIHPEDLHREAREDGAGPSLITFFSKLKDELEKEQL